MRAHARAHVCVCACAGGAQGSHSSGRRCTFIEAPVVSSAEYAELSANRNRLLPFGGGAIAIARKLTGSPYRSTDSTKSRIAFVWIHAMYLTHVTAIMSDARSRHQTVQVRAKESRLVGTACGGITHASPNIVVR